MSTFKLLNMNRFPSLFLLAFLFYLFPQFSSAQLFINEYSASNLESFADNYNAFEDWVEIYNGNPFSVDISGYYLSDDPADSLRWAFPENTSIEANGFLRIWLSGRDLVSGTHFHTNFKLTQTKNPKEHVVLTDNVGTILDDIEMTITQQEHSRGRSTDGGNDWVIYTNPTPNASNNSATGYLKYADKPAMSLQAGFYDNSLEISISTTEPDATIRYTTDGSLPTSGSGIYGSPVDVSQTTIIKAIAFSSNPEILPSMVDFNTYFIGITHNMPVISAAAADLDNLLNGNQWLRPFGTFEYFNIDGERTNVAYGEYNEHGQDSWVHDQRSIDWITRDECGYKSAITGDIIPLTDRQEFQRIILRAAGDDNYPGIDTSAHLRDYFIQNTACRGNLNLDMRRGYKGVLYCNGIYWGVYGYREKVSDHDYTDYYYDQGKYDIYYLKLWGSSWAEYGGQEAWNDWNEIHDFILYNDMSDPVNFEYVKSRYDYTSLIDYVHINSYVVCSDWINWNVGWWKGLNPDGNHQRWAYTLWDEDATFNHYINYTGVPGTDPEVYPCFPEDLWNDPEDHIEILNALIDNEEFYQYYVTRYIDLYNTTFHPDSMLPYLDSIEEYMQDEMFNHVARWGGTLGQWRENVEKIRWFIQARHDYLPEGFIDCYNITGPFELSLQVDPPEAGHIKLNSLLHENFPWQGTYFGNIDNHLEAIPASPEYEFDYWSFSNAIISPNDTLEQVVMELLGSDELIAHFRERVLVDSLVINEINYNSSPQFNPEDWVELYNPMGYSLDISGWVFKDEEDVHSFSFPEGTVIDAEDFLIICRDTSLFANYFPDVENYLGDFDFGLSGGGELIRLFDATGLLVDQVPYDDEDPWPLEPDGLGPTLELTHPSYDNFLAVSWHASQANGTPGQQNGPAIGIAEIEDFKALQLLAVPNPFNNQTKIIDIHHQVLNDAEITVFNQVGEKVSADYSIVNNGEILLDASRLESGFYFVTVYLENGNRWATLKLIYQ